MRRWRATTVETAARPQRDEGSAMMFALVFVALGSLLIMPLLSYATSVFKASAVQRSKADRSEVVRGALRVALADPAHLYSACSNGGLHTPITLYAPDLGVPVHTECTILDSASELADTELRVALATVQAGSVLPVGAVGTAYGNSGNADPTSWLNDVTNESQGGRILVPYLPLHARNHASASGHMMPAWAGSCRVFIPGTYTDPITINDSVPTFFTSGVYYFENTVTFGPGSNVVIGEGAIEGCTTNADAAFYAIGATNTGNISGIGGTFIFGGAGRLVITDGGTTTGPSVIFNSRLVDPTDVGNKVSAGMSILTVNGVTTGAESSADLNLPGQLYVPKSLTETDPTDAIAPVDAAATSYTPSTLVPTLSPLPPALPVIDISLLGPGTADIYIPGYVSVPQGTINLSVTAGAEAGKNVELIGGVLAATVTQSATTPANNQLGMVNRVVQKTFKVVSITTEGLPVVTSVAIVQVNDYGQSAINSWVTVTV
ncbi:MAG: hypothetical protein Q7V88_15145 [Actinomycetota bacterium]|nr:hypothetical protein [Actinomycetota bacterium]